jgi:CRP/FNR family transcriptional regulator
MKRANTLQIIGSDQTVKHSVSCSGCMLKGSCFPIALEMPSVAAFDAIVQRARPLQKDEFVYRQDQRFNTVYAVRSGAFKAYTVSESGEEQITGFYLPGEIFGVDGLSHDRYATSVVALETSSVCAIPFDRLQKLGATLPSVLRHMFQLMSHEIVAEQEMIMLLGKYTAERRVAALLERISQHHAKRKLSANKFRLPMSRTDIGCYLGLTVETTSRVFSRFQKIGLLTLENREVEIMSLEWLHELACGASIKDTAATVHLAANVSENSSVSKSGSAKTIPRSTQRASADRAVAHAL